MNFIEISFWACSSVLILFYFTYALLMYTSAKKRKQKPSESRRKMFKFASKQDVPLKVSLVVPTYNEAKVIQRKLMNIQELEYPKDSLEVLVVDSGSTDNTVGLAKAFLENQNVVSFRILAQPKREGKASALNYVRQFCNGNIIVLTDADVLFRKDTLAQLVARFDDQSIGAVSGKIVINNAYSSTSTKFEKSYRDIFDIIRAGESNLDSTPIFNGPISAFRKELISDLNPATVADDTELSIKVREKGWKAVYEPHALAYEYTPENFTSKNKQKIRRGQGIIQSFLWHRRMIFHPKYGTYGLVILPSELFMHVVSPLLVVAVIALGILNAVLTPGFALIFGAIFAVLLIFYSLTTIAIKISGKKDIFNVTQALSTFLNSQFSLIYSMLLLVWGRNSSSWEKIEDVRALN
jgi:cellulose synthase/poly-beta-1,6-N-acetylglucosamine synthase-like glycosyltransferase